MSSTLPFPEDDDPATRYVPPSDPRVVPSTALEHRFPESADDAREIAREWIVRLIRADARRRDPEASERTRLHAEGDRYQAERALAGLRLFRHIGEQVVIQPRNAWKEGKSAPPPERIGVLEKIEFHCNCAVWTPQTRMPHGRIWRHRDIMLLRDM